MARDAAGIARNIFATIAINNKIIPANRKFPINPKSLRVTVAYPAKAKSIVAVPPAARPINCGPLLNCSAALSSGQRNQPRQKVNPNSKIIPHILFRVALIANMNPNITANITIIPMSGD